MKKKTSPKRSAKIGAPGRKRGRARLYADDKRRHMLRVYVSDVELEALDKACEKIKIPRSEFMAEVALSEAKFITHGGKDSRRRSWNRLK